MPRGRPKSSKTGGRQQLRVIDRKPIRPLERQRMRPWLLEQLNRGECHQLAWYSKKEKTFRVSWKHAAGQTFDPNADATLFELWARHTGKYYPGDKPDPKKWKANFRCALHSLPDVDEDKSLGVKKGNNAFRVYRFLDEKRVKKTPVKKMKEEDSDEDSIDELKAFTSRSTRSRPKVIKDDGLDSEGSETGYSPSYESPSSDWEMEEMRSPDEEDVQQHSPLPHFEQLCEGPFSSLRQVNTENITEPRQQQLLLDSIELNEAVDRLQFTDPDVIMAQDDDIYIFPSGVGHQEEVVGTGPSVIVIEEQAEYDYPEYTSLTNANSYW